MFVWWTLEFPESRQKKIACKNFRFGWLTGPGTVRLSSTYSKHFACLPNSSSICSTRTAWLHWQQNRVPRPRWHHENNLWIRTRCSTTCSRRWMTSACSICLLEFVIWWRQLALSKTTIWHLGKWKKNLHLILRGKKRIKEVRYNESGFRILEII